MLHEMAYANVDDRTLQKLEAALACFFGTEAMIVFSDVLRMSSRRARAVKSWGIRALLRQALAESRGRASD